MPHIRISNTYINRPECLLPHLEAFEWQGYEETPEDRKLL